MKIFNIYWWKRILDFDYYFKKIKWFWQRGVQGFSKQDTWGIDYYLADIIPKMVKTLKFSGGVSGHYFTEPMKDKHSKYDWKIARRRRDKDLDAIVYTFETAGRVLNECWHYTPTDKYYSKENKNLRKRIGGTKILTYKECKKYEEGWLTFQKIFFTLWD